MNLAVNPKLRLILAKRFTKLLILLCMAVFFCSVGRELGDLNYQIMLSSHYRLQLYVQHDSTVKTCSLEYLVDGKVLCCSIFTCFSQISQSSSQPCFFSPDTFFWGGVGVGFFCYCPPTPHPYPLTLTHIFFDSVTHMHTQSSVSSVHTTILFTCLHMERTSILCGFVWLMELWGEWKQHSLPWSEAGGRWASPLRYTQIHILK